ncbi:hypothetical protein U1Q18_044828 [Sarracenia purpurea var. burkii]
MAWLPAAGIDNLKPGQTTTLVSFNSEPTPVGLNKIWQPPDSCSKGAALGCPNVQLERRPDAPAATSNGCGPASWDQDSFGQYVNTALDSPVGFQECCDAHDLCFDDCSSTFTQCNIDFSNCLEKNCSGPACSSLVPLYLAAVSSNFGCDVYVGASDADRHCQCPPSSSPLVGGSTSYRRYFVILDTYTTTQLRSRSSDTNTIIVGVDINGVPNAGGQLVKFSGDDPQGKTYIPGLEIDFWAFDQDLVTAWISIYNGNLDGPRLPQLNQTLRTMGLDGPKELFSPTSGGPDWSTNIEDAFGGVLGVLAGISSFLQSYLTNTIFKPIAILFPNCDGLVMTWKATSQAGLITSEHTWNFHQVGFESPDGCGANSIYDAEIRMGTKGDIFPANLQPITIAPPTTTSPPSSQVSDSSSSTSVSEQASSASLSSPTSTSKILSSSTSTSEAAPMASAPAASKSADSGTPGKSAPNLKSMLPSTQSTGLQGPSGQTHWVLSLLSPIPQMVERAVLPACLGESSVFPQNFGAPKVRSGPVHLLSTRKVDLPPKSRIADGANERRWTQLE